MSTATQAPPLAEDGIVARAEAALAVVRSDAFPWPDEGRTLIQGCADWLRGDLEARDDLISGRRHPASEFPDLAFRWPDDALGQAIDRVTEDIAAWTGDLAEAVRRFCGSEVADCVLAAAAQAAQEEGETR